MHLTRAWGNLPGNLNARLTLDIQIAVPRYLRLFKFQHPCAVAAETFTIGLSKGPLIPLTQQVIHLTSGTDLWSGECLDALAPSFSNHWNENFSA
jgi:hypothetical protein